MFLYVIMTFISSVLWLVISSCGVKLFSDIRKNAVCYSVCLGVVRKLLHFWLSGPIHTGDAEASRLPASLVRTLSERLLKLSRCMLREFACKPRSLCEIDRWKATEYRTCLLYTGPVVLDGRPTSSQP